MASIGHHLYRIMTEDKGNVPQLASDYFEAFTAYSAQGYWKGQAESSIVLDVITEDRDTVYALAREIKRVNRQEAVLVEELKNSAFLV